MPRPRVIVADTDLNYIIPIQLKFVEECFEKVDLEFVSDYGVFQDMFSSPQRVDILIVSEELYNTSLLRHNIGNIFLMSEQDSGDEDVSSNVTRIFKYTNIKVIFSQIMGKSSNAFEMQSNKRKSQIVVVSSACGGVGKTTVALGICSCLALKNQKRVLYINADYLQSFQNLIANKAPITDMEVYTNLASSDNVAYEDIKHVVRNEGFYYLPPFKTALLSLGIDYLTYINIAISAKNSNEYDYVIIDTNTSFDEYKAKMLSIADKVIVVTNQRKASIYATNLLARNVNGINDEKYIFVCNAFENTRDNALISHDAAANFTVSEYVEFFPRYDSMKVKDYMKSGGIQKVAFLIV